MAALTDKGEAIRTLNDLLRQRGLGGRVVVTAGVRALGDGMLPLVQRAVAQFDAFGEDNDPHDEHDFGAVQVHGHRLFFKIDYFDADLQYHSLDPSDPAVTCRVMTLMLAEEY